MMKNENMDMMVTLSSKLQRRTVTSVTLPQRGLGVGLTVPFGIAAFLIAQTRRPSAPCSISISVSAQSEYFCHTPYTSITAKQREGNRALIFKLTFPSANKTTFYITWDVLKHPITKGISWPVESIVLMPRMSFQRIVYSMLRMNQAILPS